jgi:hypothetical protein
VEIVKASWNRGEVALAPPLIDWSCRIIMLCTLTLVEPCKDGRLVEMDPFTLSIAGHRRCGKFRRCQAFVFSTTLVIGQNKPHR